jgi:hypothetical protein
MSFTTLPPAAGFGRVELPGSAGAPFEELDARLIALAER